MEERDVEEIEGEKEKKMALSLKITSNDNV